MSVPSPGRDDWNTPHMGQCVDKIIARLIKLQSRDGDRIRRRPKERCGPGSQGHEYSQCSVSRGALPAAETEC